MSGSESMGCCAMLVCIRSSKRVLDSPGGSQVTGAVVVLALVRAATASVTPVRGVAEAVVVRLGAGQRAGRLGRSVLSGTGGAPSGASPSGS